MTTLNGRAQHTVILGVAASDAHAVANHLIAHLLRTQGYRVINLGTCTPVSEFAATAAEHPEALAVIIGSLNGHVHEDLRDLRAAKDAGLITCPVIVGGNLSVGSRKDSADVVRLYGLGVDYVPASVTALPALLVQIEARRQASMKQRAS